MKQLILLAGMLLAMTAKLVAQENNGIEVNHFQLQKNELQKENNQFEIVAHENVDVDLKFSLKTEDNINIIVRDKQNKIIMTDNFKKAGQNNLSFSMEENEKYCVTLNGEKQSNLIVQFSNNK
jgi:hypothetical protein